MFIQYCVMPCTAYVCFSYIYSIPSLWRIIKRKGKLVLLNNSLIFIWTDVYRLNIWTFLTFFSVIFLVHKIHKLTGAGKNFKRSHFLDEVNPERLSDLPVVKEQAYERTLWLLVSYSHSVPFSPSMPWCPLLLNFQDKVKF